MIRCSDTPATYSKVGMSAYGSHMTNHYEASMRHIDRVTSVRERLRDLYAQSLELDQPADRNMVGLLHGELGDSLKLAEVHATLAVAQKLEQLGLSL